MPRFSIRNPYFIVVCCLALLVLGVTSVARMPVDLFPPINLPEVVVATFYSGMPPQDIEIDMTNPLERFFTLASGIDHMESRSMLGVSIIKIYFQPGTNADADVTEISNLALADLKRLPPGTLPPVVLKFDASSLPVCLVTVKGQGLTETQLHDYAQFAIRNQIAVVKGAEIPPPFGGKYRQAMVYVDPYKLLSRQMTPMDVVKAVNESNLILPAGDVKMGPYDYYVYSNSLVNQVKDLNNIPIKTVGTSWVTVGDVGKAEDANQIQYNIVRVDGQKSCYIPIMKQGGDTNTIEVVNGVKELIGHLFDIPKQMIPSLVFDQSVFVKEAIKTVLHEGLLGLFLTSHHDSALSRKRCAPPPQCCFPFPFRHWPPLSSESDGEHGEHDDSRGPGAGLFAGDRQFRDLARKHLSSFGDGRLTAYRRRGGGSRGEPGGPGCDPGGRRRLSPGHFSLRREQIPLFRVGPGLLPLFAGVIRGGDDGDPPVLLAFLKAGPQRRGAAARATP